VCDNYVGIISKYSWFRYIIYEVCPASKDTSHVGR